MSKIITDYKKMNLQKIALLIILKDGTINAVPKISGFSYHAEYLKLVIKNNKSIRDMLKAVDMNYYLENPSDIITDIYPLFSLEDATVFINLAPNIKMPTKEFLAFFPEKVPKSTKTLIAKMDKILENIEICEIGKYKPELNFYEIFDETKNLKGNDKKILEILEDSYPSNINAKKK